MPIYKRCRFLLLTILFYVPNLNAQKVENLRFEQSGKQIIIYYDLTNVAPNQKIEVQVFCSTDGGKTFSQALTKVSGDVGNNQSGGTGKKILWDVLAEVEKLEGEIQFEIKFFDVSRFDTFTDVRDGKIYKTVKIGSQVWMAENLSFNTGSGCWMYDNETSNATIYGRLYDWETAIKVCPAGWHLPSDKEWATLTQYLGGVGKAGGKMKEAGKTHWLSPNKGATDESGFKALPGGIRKIDGSFYLNEQTCYLWSSTVFSVANAWYRSMSYHYNDLYLDSSNKKNGFSVRCVKD